MNLGESARFALAGVTANRMRSVLTMSGIVIGVSSVIILVAAGQGASNAILGSFSGLGSDTITITPQQGGTGGRAGPGGGGPGGARSGSDGTDTGTEVRTAELTDADAEALLDRQLAPDVLSVAPVIVPSEVIATYRGASHTIATVTGTTPAYLVNNDETVQAGATLTDDDVARRRRVVLVGVTVGRELAGGDGSAILDQTIQLNGVGFTVVGVLTEKGNNGPGPPGTSRDSNDKAIAPLSATRDALTGYQDLSSISVRSTSSATVDAATSEVRTILNTRHRVTPATEDYDISSSAAILDTISTITTLLTALLGAVAAISLVVGGIGVMNIMLVTVSERTREIGIRKAIGAQRSDIIGQFLLEAVMLSVFGGVIGVVLGVAVGSVEVAGVQLSVAPYSIYLAFGFSVAVGVFFGLYPANKAAALKPIDALRYE